MNEMFDIPYQNTGEDVRSRLAANLRRLRVARQLSLSALARSTSMSKATLSGIESARANPTVDTLAALAIALGVSIVELLQQPELGEVRIVRAAQLDAKSLSQTRINRLDTLNLAGEVSILTVPARKLYEASPRSTGSRSHVFVLAGKLIAGPADRISELSVGDYASFPSDVPHVYEAASGIARALLLEASAQD